MSAEIAATELRAHRTTTRTLALVIDGARCCRGLGRRLDRLASGRASRITDDAYVQAARSTISSNVTGQVATILVKDNQRVHRGDVLFQLDDASFRIAVQEATAKIASAGLQMDAGRAAYQQQVALISSAQDNLVLQQKEFERIAELRTSGIATASQYDQAEHTLVAARQQVVSLQQQAASVKALLGNYPSRSEHPMIAAAAGRARSRATQSFVYNDSRARRRYRHQGRAAPGGRHDLRGAPVFALISTRDVWVEANFKEDQLTYMRTGQPATVEVDTYRGRELKAHVASLSPGTGSQFTRLPPENATGNWVKVVQRLPVRLELDTTDGDLPLAHGSQCARSRSIPGIDGTLFAPSGSR
jgi:membrane fusion protein (multidrug efflux system)